MAKVMPNWFSIHRRAISPACGGGVARSTLGNDERVLDGLLLKADYLREAQAGQQLDVEDLLDGALELQECRDLAAAQVDHRHAAFQLLSSFGQRYPIHGGGRTDLRQTDEGVWTAQRQAAREAGQRGHGLPAGG